MAEATFEAAATSTTTTTTETNTTTTTTTTTNTTATATTTETTTTTTETTTTDTTTTTTTTTKTKTVRTKNWLPLESNPELMNNYISKLGVDPKHQFHEIWGVDASLLAMVPQPVHALLLAFPISKASEAHKKEEQKKISEDGQEISDKLWFIKQKIGNACGTIGLLHAILNCFIDGRIKLVEDKFFSNFFTQTKDMDMEARAKALDENKDIEEEHQVVASEGKSEVSHKSNMNMHFNAFTIMKGVLYEFDGRKEQPINHGKCTPEELLQKGVEVIKQFMARDPKDIRFNLAALGDAQ